MKVSALLTCHDRRVLTIASIAALGEAAARACVDLRVWLVDDGSSDGTGEEVAARFPFATVIRGDGHLFWNGGMRLAWQRALEEAADFFLWINDDLAILPDAIGNALTLYARSASGSRAIIVGRTLDRPGGRVTYGGYRRASRVSHLRFRHLTDAETDCDTMNGNFVLLPARAVADVGVHAARYRHSFGDIDYGLRARGAGYRIVELKSEVGYQPANEAAEAMHMRATLAELPEVLTNPKSVPVREWLHFCRMHGGPIWPVNFLLRYAKMVGRGLRARPARPAGAAE